MSGRYDNVLEWPVTATVTVHLLNQNEDKDHIPVVDKQQAVIRNKVIPPTVYGEWINFGECRIHVYQYGSFLSPSYQPPSYISNNYLFFKVKVDVNSQPKPWLV